MMALRPPTPARLRTIPWGLYVRALLWLPRVDWQLRRHGYAATRDWLARRLVPGTGRALTDDEVLRWARAVSLAARYTVWPTSCLRQALLLHAVLAHGAQPSELNIGVALEADQGFGAHAWVRWRGRVIIGGVEASARYTRLL